MPLDMPLSSQEITLCYSSKQRDATQCTRLVASSLHHVPMRYIPRCRCEEPQKRDVAIPSADRKVQRAYTRPSCATSPRCHCEEPRRGDVAIPLGTRRLPRPMPYVLLRYAVEGRGEAFLAPTRGIDSFLALTTGRTSLVYLLLAVPNAYELMQ